MGKRKKVKGTGYEVKTKNKWKKAKGKQQKARGKGLKTKGQGQIHHEPDQRRAAAAGLLWRFGGPVKDGGR